MASRNITRARVGHEVRQTHATTHRCHVASTIDSRILRFADHSSSLVRVANPAPHISVLIDLNLQFLVSLDADIRGRCDGTVEPDAEDSACMRALASIESSQETRAQVFGEMAACSFALYEMPDLANFVSGEADNEEYVDRARDSANGILPHVRISQVGLLQLWHLSHLNPVDAVSHFGVDYSVVRSLRELPAVRLPRIAEALATNLVPRWAQHDAFWTSYVRAAAANEIGELRAARLLGRQLLSAQWLGVR